MAAAACLVLAFASVAAADPITVTGSISLGAGRGAFRSLSFSLQGDQVSVQGFQGDGPSQPGFLPACNEFSPCSAGGTTSPSGTVNVVAIGSAVLDGTTYDPTQYFGGSGNVFTFTAESVMIPGVTSDTLSLTTPFTFAGLLDVFALNPSSKWSRVRSLSLSGFGTATVNFRRTADGYAIQTINYDFATPEPGTLLTLGTGLAFLIWRLHRSLAMPAKNHTHSS